MPDTILERCEAKGLRMTEQRRIVARVLQEAPHLYLSKQLV